MEASCLSIVLPVRQCAHFFTRCSRRSSRNKLCFGAPALSALVAPVICQHICRRPKPFHSMAMTLELQRPLIRSDPIRKTPQKTTAKKRGYKKERGKRFFLSLSRVRILSATVPFLYASLFPLFRLVSLKLGRSFLSLTPANSQIAFLYN